MPYTRPPTVLQQCGKYTKIATLWLVDRGVDFVKDQAGVFYKTPQEYSDESWKRRNFQTTGIKVFRGAYTGLREERKKLWDPSWVGRQWVSTFYTSWKYQQEARQEIVYHPEPPAEGHVFSPLTQPTLF
ncbi:hypothetical protein NLI96_g8849 [Meripilus lineatus]|uniref:Uncharacterized protein n=1 Tax=Meripilus lineatus TaxID=2056292 RepID=A0AAD5YFU3_9APHY|nr:hypothetical protein NLI96_g8849 [Physisporinus lineatus]